jgi:hypothetical protein
MAATIPVFPLMLTQGAKKLTSEAQQARVADSRKVALRPSMYDSMMPLSTSGGKISRNPVAPAAMTCRGSMAGSVLCRLEIRTFENMDSPEDTKIAAPTSWKTKEVLERADFRIRLSTMVQLTVEDCSSRGDIFICSKSLSCHDRRLERQAESDASENLIAKPYGSRRLCVESVDEATSDGRKARSEDHEWGEEA